MTEPQGVISKIQIPNENFGWLFTGLYLLPTAVLAMGLVVKKHSQDNVASKQPFKDNFLP